MSRFNGEEFNGVLSIIKGLPTESRKSVRGCPVNGSTSDSEQGFLRAPFLQRSIRAKLSSSVCMVSSALGGDSQVILRAHDGKDAMRSIIYSGVGPRLEPRGTVWGTLGFTNPSLCVLLFLGQNTDCTIPSHS